MSKIELISKILSDMVWKEDVRSGIWSHKDDSPYQDLYMTAHGDMLPDDFRYQMIHDVLIRMSKDPDGDGIEVCDACVPVYTSDLMTWLSSRNDRYAFVDDAIEQYGKGESITNDIMGGYLIECMEVYDLINGWINEHLDEGDDDE